MLSTNQRIKGKFSSEIFTVIKELGQGGQGVVYLVEGQKSGKKALKWYFDRQATADQKLAICELVMRGAPDNDQNSAFAWPLDVVEEPKTKGFGYVMNLIDFNEYITIGKMMSNPNYAPSMEIRCKISIKLVTAFAKLHAKGYCYRDINENNFMFNINTGDIIICDNDNVGFDSSSKSQVLGQIDYMAPEIIMNKAKPSKLTDYHSLAVLLFKFWIWHHPFEGLMEYGMKCWDRDAKAKVYGKNPVFIFNENDKRNAVPDDEMYDYVKSMWEIAPAGLKTLFNEAFVEGIQNPRKRVIEQKWIKALGVLLDTISHCPHDNAENFWYDDKQGGIRKIRCWYCGDEYDAPPRIKIKNKNNNMVIARIAVKPNTKLLLRHIESNVDSADAEIVLGELVQHPADRNVWGLRNTSDDVWQFENSKGVVTEIPNGKTVPIFKDNKVMFSDLVVAEFEM